MTWRLVPIRSHTDGRVIAHRIPRGVSLSTGRHPTSRQRFVFVYLVAFRQFLAVGWQTCRPYLSYDRQV